MLLIREDATGKKSIHRIDLTDANFINSPYYYVQQNDIIYVKPSRWYTSQTMSTIRSSISSVLSLVSTAASIMVWVKLADR